MNDRDLLYFKKRLDLIDWNGDFAKADKGNYEVLDKLCEYIEIALNVKQNSKIVEKALLILAENVGCAEDFERYEENFVNRLSKEVLLTKEQAELFYHNINRRQGQKHQR